MKSSKVYFPNLNGLRFIAAFLVIIHHLEQLLSIFGLKNSWNNPIILEIGGLGVELFFVLSGFLITYLLLVEEQNTSTISIKSFYLRRVFRIWPLYYFIGLLSFFILPYFNFFELPIFSDILTKNYALSLILYVLFLPNLLLHGYGVVVPYASQSWSVGVEEQFYLIWPLLMKFFKNKLTVLLSVIIIYLFIHFVGFRFVKHFLFWNSTLELLRNFWSSFNIQCMAIGGVFAWLMFNKNKFIKLLCSNYFYLANLLVLILFISFSIKIPLLNKEVYALLFGVLILNLASSKSKGVFLENVIFNYLGKISYGLYMYHVIAIVICIKLFLYFNIIDYHLLLLLSCLLLTVMLAGLSYRLIEKRFISLKTRYSKVISGDNAK